MSDERVAIVRTVSRSLFGAVPPLVWLLVSLVAGPLLVVAGSSRGLLEPVALAAVGIAGIVFAVTRPFPLLLLYVALIPLETVVVIDGLATLSRLVGAVFFAGYFLRRFGRVHLGAMPVVGWVYLGWSAVSILWALDPDTTLGQLLTLGQLFVMTLAIADYIGERPEQARPIMWTYTAAALLTAVIAVGGVVVGQSVLAAGRLDFDDQDPAQFAAVLLPALFFMVFELIEQRTVVVAALGSMVCAVAVILSGTRSAWLAIGVAIVIGVLPRLGRRAFIPGIGAVLVFVALLQVPEIGALVSERTETAIASGGAGRVDIWTVGLDIFAAHPLQGVGLANFPIAFSPEVIRGTEIPGLDAAILLPGEGPHSSLIGTLAELGIIGALLLAGLLATTLLRRGRGRMSMVVQVALLALVVQSLFLDVLNRKQLWLLIAIALGLAWRVAVDRRAIVDEERRQRRMRVQALLGTWARG